MKQINAIRQGEILLLRMPKGSRFQYRQLFNGGTVIREGEKSGHKHELEGQFNLFQTDKAKTDETEMILEVGKGGAELKHPEHDSAKIPEGEWKVETQREYDEKKHKKVKD